MSYSARHKEYLAQQNEAVRQTIEAGYHCAWTMDEIMQKVRGLGSTLDLDAVYKLYNALHDSIGVNA